MSSDNTRAGTKTRESKWMALFGLAVGIWLAFAALSPHRAGAQFLDPPLGWDMWDPGATHQEVWEADREDPTWRWRLTRHAAFVENGVPEAYRGARNPLAKNPKTVRAGGRLYADKCASCHDPSGMGGGEAGLALYPSPALLAHLIRMPTRADKYLVWSISDGGKAFATDMPAFKGVLSDEQIWQIITFMRAGFPEIGDETAE